MTTCIIAEKPSVARDIARIVGATSKQDGYMEGCGYVVTWVMGHLVALAMPEAYGFSAYKAEDLPIRPNPFQLVVRQVRKDKEYVSDPAALKQLKVIRSCFDKADRIIVATDAGREGELIFRYIYQHLNCHKPFDRLWISSLTDKAIREGLSNLKHGNYYDNLYSFVSSPVPLHRPLRLSQISGAISFPVLYCTCSPSMAMCPIIGHLPFFFSFERLI